MPQRPPKRRRTSRFRRHPFHPPEPAILSGTFAGKKLSELSDEELMYFMKVDARFQSREPVKGWFAPSCPDVSQYWFAKYELEKRKPKTEGNSGSSMNFSRAERKEVIARKIFDCGFRLVLMQYHPDHGGDTEIMKALNLAREFARERLRG